MTGRKYAGKIRQLALKVDGIESLRAFQALSFERSLLKLTPVQALQLEEILKNHHTDLVRLTAYERYRPIQVQQEEEPREGQEQHEGG